MCNDDDSSENSENEDDGSGSGAIIGGENIISLKDLIDNNLTELLNTMKKFPLPTDEQIHERAVTFGPQKRMKTLIFDMDETLIHAEILLKSQKAPEGVDFHIEFLNPNEKGENVDYCIYVKMRPYLDECLEYLAQFFEIAVFTAGEQSYADSILDVLDTDQLIS